MNNKTKILDAAQKHLQKGAYDKAIRELQKLLDEDPRDVRTLLKIGDIYRKKGDGAEAARTYRRVAETYSEQGFFLKAVAVYKQILSNDPQNLEVSLKLAELYEHLGQMQEAMGQYQLVANVLEQRGAKTDWLNVLHRMVELEPDNVASRVRYAEALSREQRAADAIEQFSAACELLQEQQRDGDWVKVAERLVFHDPARFDVLKRLAKSYLAAGDMRRAIARLEPCYKNDARDAETLSLLGRAFSEADQGPKAVFIYKELAKLYGDLGRANEVRNTYHLVLELDPNDAEANKALGRAAAPKGGETADLRPSVVPRNAGPTRPPPEASQPPVKRPAPARPSRAPLPPKVAKEITKLLTETDVYVKYGLRDKALDHLKKIFELDPESLEGYQKMRDVYLAAKDPARAADALAMVIKIHRRAGKDAQAEKVRAELAKLVPGHPLARGGDHDLEFTLENEEADDDIDSIDIDVDEGGGDDEDTAAASRGAYDTSDLSLEDSSESVRPVDILEASTARPSPRAARATDVGVLGGREMSPAMLFDGGKTPIPEDAPLAADFMGEEPRPSQLPSPADAGELLSLLEGGDDALEDALAEMPDESDAVQSAPPSDAPSAPPLTDELDPAYDEDLENVEFLVAQELFDEAREALLELLPKAPLNRRVREALQKCDAALGTETELPEIARPKRRSGRPASEKTSDLAAVPDDDEPLPEVEAEALPAPEAADDDEPVFNSPDPEAVTAQPMRAEEAMAAYESPEAIEAADAELMRGYELQQQGNYADAMAAYENATLVSSRAAQAYEMLGMCLQAQDDTMGAVTAFYKALEAGAPADRAPRLKYEIGIACENANDLENALAWYYAAYTDDPTQPHLAARIENLGGHVDPPGISVPPPPPDEDDEPGTAPATNGVHEPTPTPKAPSGRRNKISYL